jgi:hypothetical protein
MLQQAVTMYRPYVLGIRSFLNYASGGLLAGTPAAGQHSKSIAASLDIFSQSSPFGTPCMYKSLEAAAIVLQLARGLDDRLSEENELAKSFFAALDQLQIFFLEINRTKGSTALRFEGKQVVVLEGFDRAGKSTLAESFVSRFDYSSTCALENCYPEMKTIFTSLHEATAAAFEFVSCYFLAREIFEAESNQTIIVERFYHFACANAACVPSSRDPRTLPEIAFYWPNDLPKPDLVSYAFILFCTKGYPFTIITAQ